MPKVEAERRVVMRFGEGNYADRGCRVWGRCLTCPLRYCIYDPQSGGQAILAQEVGSR